METERLTLFAHVLLPLAIPGKLTYRVPEELNEWITIGKRVIVPLGKRKLYAGIILQVSEKPPEGFDAKYILSVLDDVPVVTEEQLDFWAWIAHYYMCTLGEVMKAALPAALKLESESTLVLADGYNPGIVYDVDETILIDFLEKAGEISISSANAIIKKHSIYKIIKSLYQKGAILVKEDIYDNYRAKAIKCVRIHPEMTETQLREVFDQLEKKGKRQLHTLMSLYSYKSENKYIERSAFLKDTGATAASLNALQTKEIVEFYEVDKKAYQQLETKALPELSEAQNKCLTQIEKSFEKLSVCLLFGITSSGKTHVYFHLIKKVIDAGKQVLFIVPEMALTAHLVHRFKLYFGVDVEVTHSGYSQNERMETWNNVSDEKTKIILGVRSSLFMPFRNLGLIIVDEEHETTLKQQDPAPRYHARESAAVLAKRFGAKIILGSATPSIESWHNAKTGKYGFAELTERFGGSVIPKVELVNLGEAVKGNRMKGPFSSDMIDALEMVIKNKKQAIIFQNRRGYVPVTECNVCGWAPRCVNCDVTLTYYNSSHNYRCNFCGFKKDIIQECASCGSTRLKLIGYGTERLEEDLKIHLPGARIERFDSESTRNRKNMESLIKKFEDGEIDILVGTQMLSKGLDFDKLDFVGVINADHLINFPDFRSVERSFQLLVQVAGRAGRRDVPGLVMVQTFQPWHKVLEALTKSEIDVLYEWELAERLKYHYPPFSRVIRLTVKHPQKLLAEEAANILADGLKVKLGDRVLGPESPYIARIRNIYLQQIMIKFDPSSVSASKLKEFIAGLMFQIKTSKKFKQVYIVPDVDPYY